MSKKEEDMKRFTSSGDDFELLSPCVACLHKHIGAATCDAFPDGIPKFILNGYSGHRQPIAGDHGIQFEPIKQTD